MPLILLAAELDKLVMSLSRNLQITPFIPIYLLLSFKKILGFSMLLTACKSSNQLTDQLEIITREKSYKTDHSTSSHQTRMLCKLKTETILGTIWN